jgi:hypothetical protein
MSNSIYFIEPDKIFGEEVTEAFSGFGYPVEVLPDFTTFLERMKKKQPEAIFIRHRLLSDSIDLTEMLKANYSVAYGEDIDLDQKLHYYRIGFSRVLGEQYAQPALLRQFLKVNLYDRKELRPLIISRITQGNLREFRLVDILYNSLLQKRNIIFKIEDDHWFAKIRTFQGHLVEAISPGNQGIDALLEIMRHQNGRLRLQSYQRSKEESKDFCSTFALVNEAKYQENVFRDFEMGTGTKNPIFRKNTKFKKQFLPYQEDEIYNLIDGNDGLHTILRKSPLGLLATVRSLEKLLKRKAITFEKTKTISDNFSPEDYDLMRERLILNGKSKGLVLVFGGIDSEKSQFMSMLASSTGAKLKSLENAEMLNMPLDKNSNLQIVGIPTDANVDSFVSRNITGISAALLLINFQNKGNFEYIKYFLKQFLANYHVTLVIGFINVPIDAEKEIEKIRGELEIPLQIESLEVTPDNFQSIRRTFYQLMDLPLKVKR